MSYSRWSNSNWYSFYNCMSGETKDSQLLSLWYAGSDNLVDLTYDQLIEIKSPKELAFYYEDFVPLEDLVEAMEYIQWFIDDVDGEFDNDEK